LLNRPSVCLVALDTVEHDNDAVGELSRKVQSAEVREELKEDRSIRPDLGLDTHRKHDEILGEDDAAAPN